MVDVSAILTTRNRDYLLPAVLDALEAQSLGKSRFEIIAIDDGSTDQTPHLLKAYSSRLPLRIFRQSHAGLAEAKNLGILASQGDIVVFLDDDDVAGRDLLAAHLAAHIERPDPTTAILGHTCLAHDVSRSPLMRYVTEVGHQLFAYGWMKPGQELQYTEFWGGRSSCKRKFLLHHGLFDPRFKFGCEDIELGWRLRRHGLRVFYEPSATATMIRAISFEGFCERSYRQGRSQFHYAQLHPDVEVRRYCEIDDGLASWAANWRSYAARLRHVEKLDRLANVRLSDGFALPARFQAGLNQAYGIAFALSRAKGIFDSKDLHVGETRRQTDTVEMLPIEELKARIGKIQSNRTAVRYA